MSTKFISHNVIKYLSFNKYICHITFYVNMRLKYLTLKYIQSCMIIQIGARHSCIDSISKLSRQNYSVLDFLFIFVRKQFYLFIHKIRPFLECCFFEIAICHQMSHVFATVQCLLNVMNEQLVSYKLFHKILSNKFW